MDVQTIVRRKSDGALGVVVRDSFGCCSSTEVPVVYHGESGFLGTEETDLEMVGPENAIADFQKCGAGQGAECCMFLTVGSNGSNCERHSSMRYSLLVKSGMVAQRHPVA